MKIRLFKAFPDLYRKSMEVYSDSLEVALRLQLDPADSVMSYSPEGAHLAPRLARYWSQYVGYQLQAPRVQRDINHVIDHAYGHLLYSLDPTKTVVTFHDAIALKTRVNLIQRYNLSGIRRAAVVLCDSEAARRDFLHLCEYPPERVRVIYLGVNENFFKSPDGNPKQRLGLSPGRTLLHVGHSKSYKNIPALLHVLSILTRSLRMDVQLLKVGGRFVPDQEKLARQLGVSDKIVHLGIVPQERLPEVYRCADLLLYPSWDEGFGLPVLEAMASGIPVVASNRGSLPEIIGDAGLLVDPSDYEGMAKTVADVLEQQPLRGRLSEAGLKRARLFTWVKTAQQTLQVYRKVYEARQRK